MPGTRKLERLEESFRAVDVELTPDDLGGIDAAFSSIAVKGGRGTGQEQYL